jgi:hypothetical protein
MRGSVAVALAAGLLAGAGCVSVPDTYAPPIQRNPTLPTGSAGSGRAEQRKHFLAMGDEDAAAHILGDINDALEGGTWRWTGQKPTVRLFLKTVTNLRLVMDFSIPGPVLEQTGPLTIRYVVNGHLVEALRYDTPGQKRFEKPVEASWLHRNGDNIVSAELDKVYIAEADKARLGIALTGIGFVD